MSSRRLRRNELSLSTSERKGGRRSLPPLSPSGAGHARSSSGRRSSSSFCGRSVPSLDPSETTSSTRSTLSSSSSSRGRQRSGSSQSSSSSSRRSAPVDVDDAQFIVDSDEDADENPYEGMNACALELLANGEFDLALRTYHQVLDRSVRKYGLIHPLVAQAHKNVGEVHRRRAQGMELGPAKHEAETLARESFKNASRASRGGGGASSNASASSSSNRKSAPVDVDGSVYVDPCEHIEGMTSVAAEHLRRGEHDLAIRTYEQILESHVEWYGPIHPNVANVLHNVGMAHVRCAASQSGTERRESEEAALIKLHDAIRVIRSCDNGKTHPLIAASLFQIGVVFVHTDRQADAISALRESLRIRRLNPDPSNALVAKTYAYVGACHLDLGHYAEGRKAFESSLEVQRSELSRLFETDQGDVRMRDTVARTKKEIADTLFNLGSLLLAWAGRGQGVISRVEDAEVAFAEALAIRVEILGPNHPLVAKTRVMHDAAHCDC